MGELSALLNIGVLVAVGYTAIKLVGPHLSTSQSVSADAEHTYVDVYSSLRSSGVSRKDAKQVVANLMRQAHSEVKNKVHHSVASHHAAVHHTVHNSGPSIVYHDKHGKNVTIPVSNSTEAINTAYALSAFNNINLEHH